MSDSSNILGSSTYRELSEIPTFKVAQFQSPNVIRVTTSSQDHVRNVHRQIVKTFMANEDDVSVASSVDSSEVVASMVSPSGKYLAILREIAESSSPDKKRYVEIWAGDRLTKVENVTDKHGQFYTDEFMSSISFSPSEMKLAYVAEAKIDEDNNDPLSKYRFIPDLGEAYGGRKKPSIFLLDLTREVGEAVVPLALAESSPAAPHLCHPIFAGEDKVVALSYEYSDDGRLLGVINVQGKQALKCSGQKLTSPGVSCRSPRVFERDGRTYVVFASNAVGGPHHTCSRIETVNLDTYETHILVDTVLDPSPDEFPGLYTPSLPVYPFLRTRPPTAQDAEQFLLVSSVWRCRTTLLLISLTTGNVANLTPDTDEHWSWTMLCTDGHSQVVCARSALNKPHELVLGQVGGDGSVAWRVLAKPSLSEGLQDKLNELTVSIVPIPDHFPTETIIVQSKTDKSRPCITCPHGGPHSASTTMFSLWQTSFALEGYTVAQPNYTGSIGFGEKYVKKLLGKAGTLDVGDCIASIRYHIELGISPPTKQYLTGGSHGGFLIGNLLGRYPNMFVAATMRNPVTNLGETSVSDIPDWYFEEIGERYTVRFVMTPDIYKAGFEVSPMAFVDNVRCPVEIHLGLKDQRVALDQGKKFYHALKGRGQDVELLVFKDDMHAIDSVEGSRASYHATKALFERCRT